VPTVVFLLGLFLLEHELAAVDYPGVLHRPVLLVGVKLFDFFDNLVKT
jgi:hypothetical protein